MDESFLSNDAVIAASRRFVCLRLATYESAEEAKFLKSVFVGRSGELENTVFCILSPDGKRKLVRPGRSPHFSFQGSPRAAADRMATTMNRIADQYEAKRTNNGTDLPLPLIANVRLALNIAACDNQPLIVLMARTAEEREQLTSRMSKLAWSDEFIGQFQFVVATSKQDVAMLEGMDDAMGFVVVQPGQFGLDGAVVAHAPKDVADAKLASMLHASIVLAERKAKDTRSHIMAGNRYRVHWETAIPVTDPNSPPPRNRSRRP